MIEEKPMGGVFLIRISSWLYLHPLTVLLFVFGYWNRTIESLFVVFLIMTVHELSHLVAALLIGLKPKRITFYPFGVNLRLQNSMIYSISEEVILYLAGPFSNLVMALFALCFLRGSRWFMLFYWQNIGLCVLNLLPILPLDGGIILKKLLMHRLGHRRAVQIMKCCSGFLAACLIAGEVYLAYQSQWNYSMLIFCIFLFGNILCTREKYNLDFIRELLFYKEKGLRYQNQRVKTVLLREGTNPRLCAEHFTIGNYYIIFCVDQNGKIKRILTETELMEELMLT